MWVASGHCLGQREVYLCALGPTRNPTPTPWSPRWGRNGPPRQAGPAPSAVLLGQPGGEGAFIGAAWHLTDPPILLGCLLSNGKVKGRALQPPCTHDLLGRSQSCAPRDHIVWGGTWTPALVLMGSWIFLKAFLCIYIYIYLAVPALLFGSCRIFEDLSVVACRISLLAEGSEPRSLHW